jgi:hypothetical protein
VLFTEVGEAINGDGFGHDDVRVRCGVQA